MSFDIQKSQTGIIPRSVSHIFKIIDQYKKEGVLMADSQLKLSCIELHQETIKDLLNPQNVSNQVVTGGKKFKPLQMQVGQEDDVDYIMGVASKNRN